MPVLEWERVSLAGESNGTGRRDPQVRRLAWDEEVELDIDDVIATLAVLLTNSAIRAGAALYRAGLNERKRPVNPS